MSEDLVVTPRGLFYLDIIRGAVSLYGLVNVGDSDDPGDIQLAWNDEEPDENKKIAMFRYE